MASGARLLIVGLDGAGWDVVEPLVAAGRMPVLEALRRGAAWGPLRSTVPPLTLPAWTSILTGAGPGTHGLLDFTWRVPGTWTLRYANATHRLVPSFLQVLSERGARVCSLAVPGTWPPEALNGVVVSGFDSPVATRAEARHCHPPEVWADLRARFGGLAFADFPEWGLGLAALSDARRRLLVEVDRKARIGRHLLAGERWDAFMIVFGESDTAAHHFWRHHDPASPRHDPHAPAALRETLADVYAALDRALGQLLDAARPDLLVVVSDHGSGGAGVHALHLNRFLEARGWLRYRDGRPVAGLRWSAGPVDGVRALALRRLSPRLIERAVRRVPPGVLGDLEARSRFGVLDLPATRALSEEMNYGATVHLNVAGRDPGGTVPDHEAGMAELAELLLAWEVDGHRPVRRVHRREDLYTGPAAGRAPDLVLELAEREGYTYTVLPGIRAAPGTSWRLLDRAEHQGGKGLGMNGSHRPEGLLLLHGGAVAAGSLQGAGVADVAPTALHLLGAPLAPTMEGRVLHAAAAAPRPVRVRGAAAAPPPAEDLSTAEARSLGRTLRGLGYW